MVSSQASSRSKILQYVKRLAPFSVIERGTQVANCGDVLECSKTGAVVVGTVKDGDQASYSVSLTIMSGSEIEAVCSCSSADDMREQWCAHAVALICRAVDLDFFEPGSGFSERESFIRMHTPSSSEIGAILKEVLVTDAEEGGWNEVGSASATATYTPDVSILLDISTDRLGIKVLFDNVEQEPTVFEGFHRVSSRALDNILLRLLDDEGSWDDSSRSWYVNSSKGIELILGVIQEYPDVVSAANRVPLVISHNQINARLQLEWSDVSLALAMEWLIPSKGNSAKNEFIERNNHVFGTGPFWTVVEDTIYRLSPQAARIASIFGSTNRLTIPRPNVGPLLEVLHDFPNDSRQVLVLNPENEPRIEVREPTPVLSVERFDTASEHFTSSRTIQLSAVLSFDYPAAPASENVVFIPNRVQEERYKQSLLEMGFVFLGNKDQFIIEGDAALDFLAERYRLLAKPWKISGLDVVRNSFRFAELGVTINLRDKQSDDTEWTAMNRGSASSWFDCHIALTQNRANVPLSAVFKNARADTDRWTRLDNGAYARVPGGSVGTLRTMLGMVDPNCRVSNTIKAQLSMAQAISLSRISDSSISVSLSKRLQTLSERLDNFSGIKKISTSKGFTGKLRRYQEEGISWLKFLHDYDLAGILADEMGLGKTVQALALFQHLQDTKKKNETLPPALIIAPTSVITNWYYEAKKFTPNLKTLLLQGPNRKQLFDSIPKHDIVLTSYALLRLDRYDLERFEFNYLVLDEAQNIKNPVAATTKAAKSLRARHRLALTGTPTENRPMELWSIMDFLMPGYLGSNEFFRSQIERPILEVGPAVEVAHMLNSKTRPFIMRRLKEDVEKELPPKIESVLHVDMTASQKQLYAQVLEEVRPKVFEAVSKKGIRGASVSILAALLRLRQICNHPNSIDALRDVSGFDSGKFNLLKDLVTEALESGRKILLFSQFRGMLHIVRSWLDEVQTPYLYLDGMTRNRQEVIDRFTNDESMRLFLISLKAGGTGLNLMAADTVIIYDPWWNPAVEKQAVDRAHRIGQTKTVNVYRMITEDSIEQKIMDLKAKKSKLVDALVNENGLSTVNLTKNDLELLFGPMPTAK